MTGLELLPLAIGAAAGAVTGAASAYFVSSVRHEMFGHVRAPEQVVVWEATDFDPEIVAAAADWAQAHDLPEAESLIANKLRLGLRLRDQQRRRRGGRRDG